MPADDGSAAATLPTAPPAPPGPKPRLVVDTMELENFKSYFGVVKIGPFNKSMTCVIGPNGSGKSNVIDSALFGFGFNAKDMRQENALGLIHHSSQHSDVAFARVSINFQLIIDRDGQCDVVEGSEFTLSRRIERQVGKDGKDVAKLSYTVAQRTPKGEWREKSAERKEVRELLLGHGIDLDHHNRFCILQGNIEKIALMPPKGSAGDTTVVLGSRWKDMGDESPHGASPLANEALEAALAKNKLEFGAKELAALKLEGLKRTSVVHAGGKYYMPALTDSKADQGLLEYLEDLIETNRLIEPIEAAKAAMEEAQDRKAIEEGHLKAADQQLRAQEERKADAEAYMAKEAELEARQSELYQLELGQLREDAAARKAELDTKAAELAEAKEANRGKKAVLLEIEKKYKKAKKGWDECTEKLEKAKKEEAMYKRLETEFEQEQKHLKDEHKKSLEKLAKEKRRLGEMRAELDRYKSDAAKLPDEVAQQQKRLEVEQAELEKQYEALAGEMGPLRKQKEGAQAAKERLAEALAEPLDQLGQLKDEARRLEEKTSYGAEERQAAASELQAHIEAVTRARSLLEQSAAEETSLAQRLAAAQATAAAAAAALGPLEEVEQKARARLEEARSSSSSTSAQSKLLTALMRQRDKGGVYAGIRGRLGSLGRVPAQLDIAASTCGGGLDEIVVETKACAEACVDFLREHKLGVATFLILEKQVSTFAKEIEKPFKAPKDSRRLFDLVECDDERVRCAFYKCFRDTLVVDQNDLSLARQIAFPTKGGKAVYRVVNLIGQIINMDGSMAGGGKPQQGRIGPNAADAAAVTPAQQQALEKEAQSLTQQLGAKRVEREEAEQSAKGLSRDVAKAKSEAMRLKVKLDAADVTKKMLEERVSRAASAGELTPDEAKRLKELGKEIAALEKTVGAQRAKVAEADEALKSVDARIGELGGVRLKAQKGKVEMLEGQLKGTEEALAKARAQLDELSKGVMKLDKAVEKMQADAGGVEERLAAAKAKMETETREEWRKVALAKEECQKRADEELAHLQQLDAEHQQQKATIDTKLEQRLELQCNDLRDESKKASKRLHEKARGLAELRALTVTKAEQRAEIAAAEGIELPLGEWAAVRASRTAAPEAADEEEEAPALADEAPADEGGMRVPVRLRDLSAEELSALSPKALQSAIGALQAELDRWEKEGKERSVSALVEYAKREKEREARAVAFRAITAIRDEQRSIFERLRKQRLDEFMVGFRKIGTDLKTMYRMITHGGDAELELNDRIDPFTEGINFAVRPPRKAWTHIGMLSGGEKTLASLSLVFALHEFKPTPLYVMDEIDAALDWRNVSFVANYIKERTKNAQFIIISLRNEMFEMADRLVGIYKTNEMTQSIAIDPHAFVIPAH
jgi:structural maintenance of chromosome 4